MPRRLGSRALGGRREWFFGPEFRGDVCDDRLGRDRRAVQRIPYFLLACLLTSFVYPVVAHAAWHESGGSSAYPGRAPRVRLRSPSISPEEGSCT